MHSTTYIALLYMAKRKKEKESEVGDPDCAKRILF